MSKYLKNEYLNSFVLAVLIITVIYAVLGVYPFGAYTISCSDMQYQFLDLTAGIFNNIKSGKSLFLTWGGGMGTNLYAWATYLLFTPFNILFLFFDVKYYQEVYLVITILKYGMVALCGSLYLKKSKYTQLEGIFNVAFAVLYAFGTFCLKSMINVMWLDNVAMLPIVMLGIERVIEKRKVDLLFWSFLYCVASNFYLSFITGVFCLFYFIYYYIVCADNKKIKNVIQSMLWCGVTVVLVAGLCAIILLPTWSNISATYNEVFETEVFQDIFEWQPVDLAQCFMLIQEKSAVGKALHGFFGIIPMFLTILFFFNDSFEKKEKISAFVWLFFMIFSLTFKPLYLMWHFFREPTCFYGRFMYAIAFLFIMLSARCIGKFSLKTKKLLIIPGFLLFMLGFYAVSKDTTFWLLENYAVSIILIIVYVLELYFYCKNNSNRARICVSVLIFVEIFMSGLANMTASRTNDIWPEREKYVTYNTQVNSLLNEIEDEGFYRATDINLNTMNSGLGIGYNSLECFSSLTNQRSLRVLSMLGVYSPYDHRTLNNYFNSIVTDGLLGVKYTMVTDAENSKVQDGVGRTLYQNGGFTSSFRLTSSNYEKIAENENGIVFKNNTSFPLLFKVNEKVIDIDKDFVDKQLYITGGYKTQAVFLNSLFDTDYDLYDEYELNYKNIYAAEIQDKKDKWDFFTFKLTNLPEGAKLANEGDEVGKIVYEYTVENPGEYYLDSRIKYDTEDAKELRYLTIVNGYIAKAEHSLNNQMDTIDIGEYKKDDTIVVAIQSMRDLEMTTPVLLRLRDEEYNSIYKKAVENSLSNIKQEGNDIVATCDFNEKSLVFSTISYDEGFTVYVDGEKTDKVKLAEGFLGFYVPEGSHDIRINYVSPGFEMGKSISLIALVLAVIMLILNYKYKMPVEIEETDIQVDENVTEADDVELAVDCEENNFITGSEDIE